MLVFTRMRNKGKWNTNGNSIEQRLSFGLIFYISGSSLFQIKNIAANAQRSVAALIRLFYTKNGQDSPPVIQGFVAKIFTQMMYES